MHLPAGPVRFPHTRSHAGVIQGTVAHPRRRLHQRTARDMRKRSLLARYKKWEKDVEYLRLTQRSSLSRWHQVLLSKPRHRRLTTTSSLIRTRSGGRTVDLSS